MEVSRKFGKEMPEGSRDDTNIWVWEKTVKMKLVREWDSLRVLRWDEKFSR